MYPNIYNLKHYLHFRHNALKILGPTIWSSIVYIVNKAGTLKCIIFTYQMLVCNYDDDNNNNNNNNNKTYDKFIYLCTDS